MDFRLSEEQLMLRKSARDFVKKACPGDYVRRMEEDARGYTQEVWDQMAGLGWMGLMVPERYDGMGWGLVDLAVLMEELGAACAPGPLLPTTLGAVALHGSGTAALLGDYLPRVARGELVLTLAYLEPGSTRYEPTLVTTRAAASADGFTLRGTKLFVPHAASADYLIVSARTAGRPLSSDGIALFLVPRQTEGVGLTPLSTVARDPQFEVVLDDVHLPPTALVADGDMGWALLEHVLRVGAVATCAEMVGGASRVLEMTVEYAKEREQFGKPIGAFQAVQHHCADMVMDVTGSRHITYKAAWMLDQGQPCATVVAAAKAFTSEAYKRVVARGHQIGAATAYIVDHDLPLYSRRAKAAELAFGDAAYHRRITAAAMGLDERGPENDAAE